jgi:multidrug efflux pump subunit AcrA (membrane-fusion protein)
MSAARRPIGPAPVTKTFRVYLALPETTPLRIGMSVEANIIIKEKKNALLVPAEALVGQSVFVIENSQRFGVFMNSEKNALKKNLKELLPLNRAMHLKSSIGKMQLVNR